MDIESVLPFLLTWNEFLGAHNTSSCFVPVNVWIFVDIGHFERMNLFTYECGHVPVILYFMYSRSELECRIDEVLHDIFVSHGIYG